MLLKYKLLMGIGALSAALALVAGKPSDAQKPTFANKEAPAVKSYPANAVALANRQVMIQEVNIELNSANTVLFRSEVNSRSVAILENQIMKKARDLKGKKVYLVLDTPGGDIVSGLDLIDFIRGERLNVDTITQFSASMGAYIAESLGTRYVVPHGTYMFHRARVEGVGGQIPGEFLTRTNYMFGLITKMEQQNAFRLGISLEDYTKLIKDEYWVSGEDAVKQGSADQIANISCADDLQGTYKEMVSVLFFDLEVTYSKCPAIRGPIDVQLAKSTGNPKEDNRIIQDFIYKQNAQRMHYLE